MGGNSSGPNSGSTSYLIYIFVGIGILLIVALIIAIFILNKKKTRQKPIDFNVWIEAMGNKDNIKNVSGIGSRLTVTLINPALLNQEKLNELGVTNIMKMSEKIILVIEHQAEEIAKQIQNLIEK